MIGSVVRYPRDPDKVVDIILTPDKLTLLQTSPEVEPFDGDPHRFRLGIEAMRLQLAFEYEPYFSLSIARVDPLPHQLEAVYDCFLRLPRIRFLLADDPGAGKTIMAGLLIKELKIRDPIKRVLIITPASLCFQWQREMKDKFREQFDIVPERLAVGGKPLPPATLTAGSGRRRPIRVTHSRSLWPKRCFPP